MVLADATGRSRTSCCREITARCGCRLREQFEGITPAYHMNKTHWSDLYLERLDDNFVKHQIQASYNLVVSKLQERIRETFE